MSDCCANELNLAATQARQRRVLVAVLVINLVTFALMVAGSVISGSSALLSGTLDNLGDALTYALSLAVISAGVAAKARVALFKGLLILSAAGVVAVHIGWHLLDPQVPVFTSMGVAALLNLVANGVCLLLLYPHRQVDINMSSVWECSVNDVREGIAVLAATGAVWLFEAAWPDLLAAIILLVVFVRSACRVLLRAWRELQTAQALP